MKLSNNQLYDILGIIPDEPLVDGTDTRRSAPRVECGRRARVIRFGPAGDREEARVMLHDISVAGVGFLGDALLRLGEHFVLCLNDSAEQPLYLKCTTRRCESGGMGGVSFVVGATFDALVDPDFERIDLEGGNSRNGVMPVLARTMSLLARLNPVRILRHPFKRFDDYSSLDDTKLFRRS